MVSQTDINCSLANNDKSTYNISTTCSINIIFGICCSSVTWHQVNCSRYHRILGIGDFSWVFVDDISIHNIFSGFEYGSIASLEENKLLYCFFDSSFFPATDIFVVVVTKVLCDGTYVDRARECLSQIPEGIGDYDFSNLQDMLNQSSKIDWANVDSKVISIIVENVRVGWCLQQFYKAHNTFY